jgi:hypothetical protein
MKYFYTLFLFSLSHWQSVTGQAVESYFFNLYTDSLKKGTFNYINVDALMSDGTYRPLDNKTLIFSSNTGSWDGNSLFIDTNYAHDSVVVTIALRKYEDQNKSITIYIKKGESKYRVKTEAELLEEWKNSGEKPKS